MSTTTSPISAKQRDFIDRLLTERGQAGIDLVNEAGGLSALTGGYHGSASRVIDQLLKLPHAAVSPPPVAFPPTAEQQEALALFQAGESFKVLAYAGAGKTSLLQLLAESCPDRKGRFCAFNRSIVQDASRRMPANLLCQTAHKMAYDATPRGFRDRSKKSRRQHPDQIARELGIDPIAVQVDVGKVTETKVLRPGFLAGVVMGAARNFCQSADGEPTVRHFGFIDGLDGLDATGAQMFANNNRVAKALLPCLRSAWADLCDPKGRLAYGPDHFLKQFQLSKPDLGVEFLVVDEAQDLSPVLMDICETQRQHGVQVVLVGDSFQAINGFTGAIDALTTTPIEQTTYLTKSWRFGPAIAAQANRILTRLGAPKPLIGNDTVQSTVGPIPQPTAILTRTNAKAVRILLEEIEAGGRPLLVGSADLVKAFCRGALDLIERGETNHPELAWAGSWTEVQTYAQQDELGEDLRLMVRLIDEFGAQAILDALERAPKSEADATVVVSTAHKVKGREWDTVRLADDFPQGYTKDGVPIVVTDDEWQLLYVAATRGRLGVDTSLVGCFDLLSDPVFADAMS